MNFEVGDEVEICLDLLDDSDFEHFHHENGVHLRDIENRFIMKSIEDEVYHIYPVWVEHYKYTYTEKFRFKEIVLANLNLNKIKENYKCAE